MEEGDRSQPGGLPIPAYFAGLAGVGNVVEDARGYRPVIVPTSWEMRFAPFLEKYCLLLCVCLVGIGCLRVISTYRALSLTVDEPSHFACGLEYVENHRYTFLTEQPPLSRALQALGPYLDGSRLSGLRHTQEDRVTLLARSRSFDRTVFLMRSRS